MAEGDLPDLVQLKAQLEALLGGTSKDVGKLISDINQYQREIQRVVGDTTKTISTEVKEQFRIYSRELSDRRQLIERTYQFAVGRAKWETTKLKTERVERLRGAKEAHKLGILDEEEYKNAKLLIARDYHNKTQKAENERSLAGAQMFAAVFNTIKQAPFTKAISDAYTAQSQATLLLRGAGVDVGRRATRDMSTQAFAGFSGILDTAEAMEKFGKIAATAPEVLEDVSKGMAGLIGNLARFGFTLDESIELLMRSSRSLTFSQYDLTNLTLGASIAQKGMGLHTKETTELMLSMAEALRGVGADSDVATSLVLSFSKGMKALGQVVSVEEKKALAQKMSGMGAMPFQNVMGLMAFNRGISPEALTQEDLDKFDPFKEAKITLQKIADRTGDSALNTMAVTQAVGQLFNINTSSVKELTMLRGILEDESKTLEEQKAEIEALGDPQKLAAQGIKELRRTIDPIIQMEKHTRNIQMAVSPLAGILGNLASAGGVAGVLTQGGLTAAAIGMHPGTRRMLRGMGGAQLRKIGARGALRKMGTMVGMALGGPMGWSIAAAGTAYIMYDAYQSYNAITELSQ